MHQVIDVSPVKLKFDLINICGGLLEKSGPVETLGPIVFGIHEQGRVEYVVGILVSIAEL